MMYALRTVDVWDTLLRRTCHPECVKVCVAHSAFLQLREQLSPQYADHWDVYRARLDVERTLAEESVRSGGDGEYDVIEVVRRWLEAVVPRNSGADVIERLVEYEFAVEQSCTSVDENAEAVLAAHPAERTLFLSDFYWPSAMLRRLLHEKGLGSVVADGVSSCDVGLNKRSGRLFQHVLEVHGVQPSDVVHIGDNPYSDVAAARAQGIHAVHFQPAAEHQKRLKRESLFPSHKSLFADAADQTRVACEDHWGVSKTDQAAAFRAGAEMAPLFVGFSLFVAEHAVSHRVERLFFLMREGDFLKRAFEAVHVDGAYRGHALPPASLLAVSRASTACASIRDPVADILVARSWPYRKHPLSSLVDAIGLRGEDIRRALDETKLRMTDVVVDATTDKRVRAFLSHPDIQRAASEACAAKRQCLVEYLRSEGFLENGRYATVDIGWRGTIQTNIGRLGLAAKLDGYYLALHRPLVPSPSTCEMEAYLVDETKSADHSELFDTYGVMEMLCTAPVGSTTHYESRGGSVLPVRETRNIECDQAESMIRHFQDGVMYGCQIWAPLVLRYGCSANDLVPVAVRAWQRLANEPPRVIVDAFGEAILDDPCSPKRCIRPKDVPSVGTLMAACWDSRAFTEVREYVRRIRWAQALLPTSCSPRINVRITRGLLTLGSLYRRGRRRLAQMRPAAGRRRVRGLR